LSSDVIGFLVTKMTFDCYIESPKKERQIYSNPINSRLLSKTPINLIYFIKYSEPMETNSTLVIFALIAALGLVTIVAVDIMLTTQEADAKGCTPFFTGYNASRTKCAKP
jgi:hypothetical protein